MLPPLMRVSEVRAYLAKALQVHVNEVRPCRKYQASSGEDLLQVGVFSTRESLLHGFGRIERQWLEKGISSLPAPLPDRIKRRNAGNNRCRCEAPVTPSVVNPSLMARPAGDQESCRWLQNSSQPQLSQSHPVRKLHRPSHGLGCHCRSRGPYSPLGTSGVEGFLLF